MAYLFSVSTNAGHCFFCPEPTYKAYEAEQRLHLCRSHWGLLATTLIEECVDAGFIEDPEYLEDF